MRGLPRPLPPPVAGHEQCKDLNIAIGSHKVRTVRRFSDEVPRPASAEPRPDPFDAGPAQAGPGPASDPCVGLQSGLVQNLTKAFCFVPGGPPAWEGCHGTPLKALYVAFLPLPPPPLGSWLQPSSAENKGGGHSPKARSTSGNNDIQKDMGQGVWGCWGLARPRPSAQPGSRQPLAVRPGVSRAASGRAPLPQRPPGGQRRPAAPARHSQPPGRTPQFQIQPAPTPRMVARSMD